MIQEKVKDQIDLLKKQSDKLQTELNKGLDVAKIEGQRILKEMGVDTEGQKIQLSELVAELRKANPTVRDFLRNLNVATYDNRFRINWNTTMISAYAKQQAEKTYLKDLKPRLLEVRENVATQLHDVQIKARDLKTKLIA